MDPERWKEIERICQSALVIEREKREAYLNEACAGDESLRKEVEVLLQQQTKAEGFLQDPAIDDAAKALAKEKENALAGELTGRIISHYRIIEKIGQGGMGVVYKANDTRLNRPVALKLLLPELVSDSRRKRRFVIEARAASALNHPNIITVYDIDQAEGVDFIAMEYVAGKTLDRQIPNKGMRIDKLLAFAIQMADALAAAHAAGIIHRDLKPSNVMVSDSGQVKMLDFGLAKLAQRTELITDENPLADSQGSSIHTEDGMILGTVTYMSPEQAEGKKVDYRSDIFSFGAVLYEMVSGQKAFRGDAPASIMASIIRDEPKPLNEIIVDVSTELEKVIRRCLKKAPERRFQTISDVRVELQELKDELGSQQKSDQPRRRVRRILGASIPVLLIAAFALITWWFLQSKGESELRLKPIPFTTYPGFETSATFSPDGNKIAFAWNGEKGDNYDIYVKQVSSAGPPMRLTNNPSSDSMAAWSPDDRWIAFTRLQQGRRAIMLAAPLGGSERKVTEMTAVRGLLSWAPDGKWLAFNSQDSPEEPSSIWVISIETGERRPLTKYLTTARAAEIPLGDYHPAFSPDGHSLAFSRQLRDYVWELYMLPLAQKLRPAGEPVRITNQNYVSMKGLAWAKDGRQIVYSAGGLFAESLWRVEISGKQKPERLSDVPPAAIQPAIAGKSRRLAYTWQLVNTNIWRLDTRTGERRMLIGSTYDSRIARFSPDGRKIAFESNRSGNKEVWTCDSDGSNCLQLTNFGGAECGAARWSPDNRWLAIDSGAEGRFQVYIIAADGGTPRPLTDSAASSNNRPSWSHDGRWIYFSSDISGRYEIWKTPLAGGREIQVTRFGGAAALESPDGKYIYYVKEPGPSGLFRMPVSGGEENQVLPNNESLIWTSFDVTLKGVYFVAGDSKTIHFLDSATGRISTLANLDKPAAGGIGVSPDDTSIIFGQNDQNTMDLMLVENFR